MNQASESNLLWILLTDKQTFSLVLKKFVNQLFTSIQNQNLKPKNIEGTAPHS